MSRIYFIVAALFVVAGLAASAFAPTENMGTQEAFYAHLILIAPPLFVGTVISALAMIIRRLDQLLARDNPQTLSYAAPQAPAEASDFNALFAEQLRTAPVEEFVPEPDMHFEEFAFEPEPVAPVQPAAASNGARAPTIDEFLEKGAVSETAAAPKLAREGVFAGRDYRMYEDGSLEIDTDQSTIRFDSLDEFRNFVSSASV